MSRSFLMDSIINDSKSPGDQKQCSDDIEDEHLEEETSKNDQNDRFPSHLFPYPYLFSLHAQNHLLYKNKLNDIYNRDHLFHKNINNSHLFYDPSRFYLNNFVNKNNIVKPVPIQSSNHGLSLQQMHSHKRYQSYKNNNDYKYNSSPSSTSHLGKYLLFIFFLLIKSKI